MLRYFTGKHKTKILKKRFFAVQMCSWCTIQKESCKRFTCKRKSECEKENWRNKSRGFVSVCCVLIWCRLCLLLLLTSNHN